MGKILNNFFDALLHFFHCVIVFFFTSMLPTACYADKGTLMITHFYNGRILIDHEIKEGDLWISQGKIIAPQQHADHEIDIHGLIISPGYIDLQINGGFGIDFSIQSEKVQEVARQLPKYGVTSFLPTVVSLPKGQYRQILPHLQPKSGGAHGSNILGIHLEGPFFSPKKSGAHNPDIIASLDSDISLESFYGSLEGVRIVTIAPEINGALQAIKTLKQRNIVASAGHSNATYAEMQKGIKAGISYVTHLFNAMSSFHHRDPGIVGATLTNESLFYSIIADEWHLHPATIDLAWRSNPEGLVLVSDAMAALGLGDGRYHLGMMEVEIRDGKALIQGTDILAGSVQTLDAAVRHLRVCTGCSMVQAIEAASWKPACVLGIQNEKGTLQQGADADFIFLDDELEVHRCYIGGEKCF